LASASAIQLSPQAKKLKTSMVTSNTTSSPGISATTSAVPQAPLMPSFAKASENNAPVPPAISANEFNRGHRKRVSTTSSSSSSSTTTNTALANQFVSDAPFSPSISAPTPIMSLLTRGHKPALIGDLIFSGVKENTLFSMKDTPFQHDEEAFEEFFAELGASTTNVAPLTAKPHTKKDVDRAPNTISQFLSPFPEAGPVRHAQDEGAIGSIFGLARDGNGVGALTGAISGDSTANEAWAARLAHRSAAAQPVPLQIPPATAKPILAKHDRATARQQMQREDEEEEEKRDLLMIKVSNGVDGIAHYPESIDTLMGIPNTSPSSLIRAQDDHMGASTSSNNIDVKRPSITDMIGLSEPQLSSSSTASSMLYSPEVVGRRGGDDDRHVPSLDSGGPILASNEATRSVSLHLVGSAGVGVSLGSGGKAVGCDAIDDIHRFNIDNQEGRTPVDLSVPQGKRLRRFAPGDGDVPPRPCWEKSHVAISASPFGSAPFSSIAKLEGKVLLTAGNERGFKIAQEMDIGEPSMFASSEGPKADPISPSDPSALARSGLECNQREKDAALNEVGYLNVSEL
jgi:hypothetical protein